MLRQAKDCRLLDDLTSFVSKCFQKPDKSAGKTNLYQQRRDVKTIKRQEIV